MPLPPGRLRYVGIADLTKSGHFPPCPPVSIALPHSAIIDSPDIFLKSGHAYKHDMLVETPRITWFLQSVTLTTDGETKNIKCDEVA